jgi:soluble lytic murein transglycosylase-like protein
VTWQTENDGPLWVPFLNSYESLNAVPHNLLARMAYQESRFRADIISGATCSVAGCLGLMQLNPKYFPNAGKDPIADIACAGQLIQSLFKRFNDDWQVALAAYNWGGGNVHHQWVADGERYDLADCPAETRAYVRQILSDVPVPGALVP